MPKIQKLDDADHQPAAHVGPAARVHVGVLHLVFGIDAALALALDAQLKRLPLQPDAVCVLEREGGIEGEKGIGALEVGIHFDFGQALGQIVRHRRLPWSFFIASGKRYAAAGACLRLRGLGRRHPDAAPGACRHRQLGMRFLHRRQPAQHVVGQGRHLLRRHIDVQRHVLGGGRHPAFLGVLERFEIMNALGIEIEQLELHPHRIAFMDFAQIAHVHLGGEGRVPAAFEVARPDAQLLVDLVHPRSNSTL